MTTEEQHSQIMINLAKKEMSEGEKGDKKHASLLMKMSEEEKREAIKKAAKK
jgi:hypothetical protein